MSIGNTPGVQGELDELFFWIQRALRKYAENSDCGECIRLAREGLAQVLAALEGTGREDVAGLCEEMLRVLGQFEQGAIDWTPAAAEIPLRAALRLPGQLAVHDADPVPLARALAPLLNELRALRGADPLMTAPAMLPPAPATAGIARQLERGEPQASLQDARRRFQQALLDLLRGRNPHAGIERLRTASEEIGQQLPDAPGRELFRSVAEFAAVLVQAQAGTISTADKQLLGRVDGALGTFLRQWESRGGGLGPVAPEWPPQLLDRVRRALRETPAPTGTEAAPRGSDAEPEPAPQKYPGPESPQSVPSGPSRADPVPGGPPAPADVGEDAAADGVAPASPGAAMAYDEGRLLGPPRVGVDPLSFQALDRLTRGVSTLQAAVAHWRAHPRDPAAPAAVGTGFRSLGAQARAADAPRMAEFAGVVESFLAGLPERVGDDAMQVIEDAAQVLPGLLREIRDGLPAETPLTDIVLRIQTLPEEAYEPEAVAEPDAHAGAGSELDRIRRRGAEEMARLAAAFAALDGDAAVETPPEGDKASGRGAPASSPLLRDARARASEVTSWQQQAISALAQAGVHLQELERVIAGSRPFRENGSAPQAGTADGSGEEAFAGAIEQLRVELAGAIGNASAALLQQRRAVRALQDCLDPEAGEARAAP